MSPAVLSFPGAVERFINEAVAASQIDSDHVVKIFDVGKLPSGAPYLVMEYLEGQDLSSLLEQTPARAIEVARAVHFVLQILRGLQVAHAAGIVHRDMKPSNCFVVTKDGEPDFVKLVDFGISKVQQPGGVALTQAGSALGTPLYMSPEQARSPRDVDLRSDIYSVGVILFELLTGQTPFTSESGELTEILFKLFTADPPRVESLRPDLPRGLPEVVHRALAREPQARFATAGEFGDALAPFADARSYTVAARLRAFERGRPSSVASIPPERPSRISGPAPALSEPPFRPSAVSGADIPSAHAATAAHPSHPPPLGASSRPPPPALEAIARTDLGSTRDAPAPNTTKRAPPVWLFAAPLVVVGVVGAVGFRLLKTDEAPVTQEPTSASVADEKPVPTLAPKPPETAVPDDTTAAAVEPSAQNGASAPAVAPGADAGAHGGGEPLAQTPPKGPSTVAPGSPPSAPTTTTPKPHDPKRPKRLHELRPVE
jgi:serine/threonine-protein kinase